MFQPPFLRPSGPDLCCFPLTYVKGKKAAVMKSSSPSRGDIRRLSHTDPTSSNSPSVQIYTKKKQDSAAPFPPD